MIHFYKKYFLTISAVTTGMFAAESVAKGDQTFAYIWIGSLVLSQVLANIELHLLSKKNGRVYES